MPKNDWGGEGRRIALGAAIGAAVTLLLSMVLVTGLAALMSSGKVGEEAGTSLVTGAAFIAACAGALTARVKNKGAALLSGVASSLMAIAVRFIVLLLSDRSSALDSADLTVCLAILCGGIVTGAVTMRRKRRKRR